MRRNLSAILLLASVVACSDSTGPSETFESIAGSYNGALAGIAQGIALDAEFSLTINQTGGSATGSWAPVALSYQSTIILYR
jgi:hypothetical protein